MEIQLHSMETSAQINAKMQLFLLTPPKIT